ncbi:katanin p80 WD40 repeat-containing subunit B1 homolog KTN80.2-like isoform X1 [Oryza glaberrima]|uniref:katanin p80 WD40 repeat-containing subunit B1 homolog KTN80.2-like isoform X1 n=1 Tax=Oryza glaberrima TaxID=4538 RepID=UPI00224C0EEA|nr:katanin p80 WD40 repeat-containing subunit B1 homolog KTN80.2-like isoform X1 [Oryza glaberrima]
MDPEKRGYRLQEFVAHDAEVRSLSIGKKSSRVFITGGSDRKVNLWAIGKQTPLLSLSGHTGSVEAVEFDTAEVLVLAGSSNGSIKLWDLEEAKVVRSLTGHRSSCTSVEFHPFGEFFASGSSDTDLKIWDIKKKGCIHTYKGHRGAIRTIRFTPDGRWVVTGGEDNIVKVWDLTAGKLLHDFKFHSGHIRCIDFHPQEFLLATGSADRTVKFWDLETFELIGSAGPEATGVRSTVFHPDGKTLFCGLDQSLKVFSWEPVRCHDVVDMGWSNLADLSIYEGKLLGCSYHECRVGVWVADISLIGPYALGVLPKANFFAELVHSLDDNPSKTIDTTAKSIPALATTHPKNLYKVKETGTVAESGIRGSNLTPASMDKTKRDKSGATPRRPDSSFKSSIQSSTPMRRMKAADSPYTNRKTVERNFAQRDASLASRTGTANNSSTVKKGHLAESVSVKDIYTTPQTVSVPVVMPRDILEDKTAGSISGGIRGRAAVADDFHAPVHSRKLSVNSFVGDSVNSTKSMLTDPDVCSEGFSGLKFSFGLTPYYKKEEYDNVDKVDSMDKGDNTQMTEKLDRTVSLEHQLQSNDTSESPCSTTETTKVKYVRGVAVPLGKTKSLVERWEKREATNVECSPPTGSCGDRAVRSDGPSSFSAEPSQAYEKDLSTIDEAMIPINLMQNHDEFINAVKSRLTKLEMMRHVFDQNGIKGAIAAVAKLPDNAVQADVVSTLKGKLDLFNLDIFLSFLPVLAGLLTSKAERHAIVSLELLLDLIKIFGPVIRSTLSAHSAVGVDIQAEQRLQRCSRCFNHLQKIQQVLHPLIMRGGQSAQLAQELNLSLQDLVVI